MSDLKNILLNIAPTLATALGGPLAGTAVKFLSDKFLGKPDATTDEIAQAINSATPEQLLKLKELDTQYEIEMGKQGVDLYSLEIKDRGDARARELKLAELGRNDYMPEFIVACIFIGFFTIVFMIIRDTAGIPQNSKDVIYIVIGGLLGKMSSIIDYFFGSSSSSRKKDDVINSKIK